MANCRFAGLTKLGALAFAPGPSYGFEDPNAVPLCVAMGWAEETSDPADVVIPASEFTADPETTYADGPNKGLRVLEA